MKTLSIVSLCLVTLAVNAKPRTLQAPKAVSQVDNASVSHFVCPQVLVVETNKDGGSTFVKKDQAGCTPSFTVEFRACAVYEDGKKSQDCGVGKIRVKADDEALQTLWNAARVEWEKSKGY